MFGVHRIYIYTCFFCKRHYNMTCTYQSLFVCKCNILPGVYCGNGRFYSDHSHNSGYHNIGFFYSRRFYKSFHTEVHLGIGIFYPLKKKLCVRFFPYGGHSRSKLSYLLFKQIYIFMRGERLHFYIII